MPGDDDVDLYEVEEVSTPGKRWMMMRWNGSRGEEGRRDHVTCHVKSDDVRLAGGVGFL
jgi:hypothetical protein